LHATVPHPSAICKKLFSIVLDGLRIDIGMDDLFYNFEKGLLGSFLPFTFAYIAS
jgi:hypothetical protein